MAKIIYFSAPNKEGNFDEKYARNNFSEDVSIYKFYVDSSGSRATFELCIESRAVINRALNLAGSYLQPVCEGCPMDLSGKDNILNVEKGEVVRYNNIWKVTKKAKILVK